MVSIKELEDILYEEDWKRIIKSQKDPNGAVQQRKDREQRLVDNVGFDSRPITVIAKEEADMWWRYASGPQQYRKELAEAYDTFAMLMFGYMCFWLSIAFYFLHRFV